MTRIEEDLLFATYEFSAVCEQQKRKLIEQINGYDAAYLLSVNPDELLQYLMQNYEIVVPCLLDEHVSADQQDTWIEYPDRYDGVVAKIPATQYLFHIPFDGEAALFRCVASTRTYNPPRGAIKEHELIVSYARQHSASGSPDREATAIRQQFDHDFESIRNHLQWLEKDASDFNDKLKGIAKAQIDYRRQKYVRDAKVVSALGYPLRVRAHAPQTYVVPNVRRKVSHTPPKATPPRSPEPVLEMEHYEHILSVVSNMVQVMERSPRAFAEMGEENLRDQFLVQLNGHFEGRATSETFNYNGKTDILIRDQGRNIFIAECKTWHGAQYLQEAVDQLLSYTSWRDTKTALLVFNRNRNFSKVLDQIRKTVEAHPNTKKQLPYASETGFRFVLHHQDDEDRELILTVLAFDIPK